MISEPTTSAVRSSAWLGAWLEYETDPVGAMLGTGFDRFRSVCGINGLARESDARLDVLAVEATKPGTGQFREFVRKVCAVFDTVCFWHDWNPELAGALQRYGFRRVTFREQGEKVRGWKWDMAKAPNDVRISDERP